MNYIYLIILSIILCFSITILILMVSITNSLHQKNDLELLEMTIEPKKEDFDIIDLMITEEVSKYHIIVNEPNGIQYMSDENISNMEKYVLTKILNNISQLQLQKLKYIYNDQKLEDIIYEKIQLAVISYATEINTTPNQNEAS